MSGHYLTLLGATSKTGVAIKTSLVVIAAEGADASSGTPTAIWIAVIGIAGVLSQMLLKDWLDARKARRAARLPPAPVSIELTQLRDDIRDLRSDNASLRAENERLRRHR